MVMNSMKWMATVVAVTLWAAPAFADWNLGNPYKMHFPQLPDLEPTGLDVLATTHNGGQPPPLKVLADDWLCPASGPVADIHIWGSWLNDHVPNMDPAQVWFRLSIHENLVPDHVGFSQPGAELWNREYVPYAMTVVPWATAPEDFYDPNTGQVIGGDTQVWCRRRCWTGTRNRSSAGRRRWTTSPTTRSSATPTSWANPGATGNR
jgi:hypothetical protein